MRDFIYLYNSLHKILFKILEYVQNFSWSTCLGLYLDGGKKMERRNLREKKLSGKNKLDLYFLLCLDERKVRGKEIEEELFSSVCLCEKVKGKKEIIC